MDDGTRRPAAGPPPPALTPPGRPLAKAYAAVALGLVGRAFAVAHRVDPDLRRELADLPPGFSFALRVHPKGPSAALRMGADGRLRYLGRGPESPDVLMRFQNLSSALAVLTFSASAFEVYARNGLAVSGDLPSTMAIIRALGLVESLILPRFVVARVLKRVPGTPFARKHAERALIYLALPFAGPSKE